MEETDAVKEGVKLVGVREESAEGGVRWGRMIGRRHHCGQQPRGIRRRKKTEKKKLKLVLN